jgi:hypothetical protein
MGILLQCTNKSTTFPTKSVLHCSYNEWHDIKVALSIACLQFIYAQNDEYVNVMCAHDVLFEEDRTIDLSRVYDFLVDHMSYLRTLQVGGLIHLLDSSTNKGFYTYSKCKDILTAIQLITSTNNLAICETTISKLVLVLEHSILFKKNVYIF